MFFLFLYSRCKKIFNMLIGKWIKRKILTTRKLEITKNIKSLHVR